MTTTQQDKEITDLDPSNRCDYFQAIDLGASHEEAILLANDLELFGAFLDASYK